MYKVIIVDDEKNIRERLSRLFPWSEFNFEVVGTARDGFEALALIERESPDLIFTDIKMPNMDGIQLIENLNRHFPHIDIIILSAHGDFELAQKAIGYNVKGYLLKPIMKNDFRVTMERITTENVKYQAHKQKETSPSESKESDENHPVMSKEENDYIRFAKKYVYDHYDENISIRDISNALYIHEVYFSKLFNKQVGQGFNAFLNNVRIEKAKNLLKYSDDQLKDISTKVGFSTQSYFNKVFKEIVGVSPSTFRKANRG